MKYFSCFNTQTVRGWAAAEERGDLAARQAAGAGGGRGREVRTGGRVRGVPAAALPAPGLGPGAGAALPPLPPVTSDSVHSMATDDISVVPSASVAPSSKWSR